MKPKIRLVVTDLDNTLYDWVTFFATAFTEMVDVAVKVLEIDRERLLDELRVVHRRYHNSEQPFALLETESVQSRFRGFTRTEQADRLNEAFHAFNTCYRHGTSAAQRGWSGRCITSAGRPLGHRHVAARCGHRCAMMTRRSGGCHPHSLPVGDAFLPST